MQSEVDAVNRHCASFESIKKFLLVEHPFSIESGELTPSMKVRRKIVEENYREQIETLYEETAVKL
jgi:long-chain acyl-CoA synthetase